jgi:hypothetical protein
VQLSLVSKLEALSSVPSTEPPNPNTVVHCHYHMLCTCIPVCALLRTLMQQVSLSQSHSHESRIAHCRSDRRSQGTGIVQLHWNLTGPLYIHHSLNKSHHPALGCTRNLNSMRQSLRPGLGHQIGFYEEVWKGSGKEWGNAQSKRN